MNVWSAKVVMNKNVIFVLGLSSFFCTGTQLVKLNSDISPHSTFCPPPCPCRTGSDKSGSLFLPHASQCPPSLAATKNTLKDQVSKKLLFFKPHILARNGVIWMLKKSKKNLRFFRRRQKKVCSKKTSCESFQICLLGWEWTRSVLNGTYGVIESTLLTLL